MCGIFGVIGGKPLDIKNSVQKLRHRGPDDIGFFSGKSISLGFTRLSIIDLSKNGAQPMCNEKKDVWIVFNGEIYNFLDLKSKLKKHQFKSSSDTEVLIHGYEEWGIEGLLERIDGMFAFCLYDEKKGLCYLARDRVGKKPLYLYRASSYIAFSSEVKAFFELSSFKFEIDKPMFGLWLGFSYLPDNSGTIIKNVSKVAPGHFIMVGLEDHSVEDRSFWSLKESRVSENPRTFEESVQILEKLLVESVKERLVSDVPLGILLSGGLDSSLITAIACRNSKEKINTINIAFENSNIDESFYADNVANYCGTNHLDLKVKIDDAYGEFRDSIEIFDDLSTIDGGLFSTYLMSKEVRKQGIKVVLVGEGADEVFGGYSWFQFSQFPFSLMPDILKSCGYYYAIMRTISNPVFRGYPLVLNRMLNEISKGYFKKAQYYEITHSLPNHYCMKLDKGTSAAGIEARAPFLDYKVVEEAFNMPRQYLLRGGTASLKSSNEKYILREIAKKYLPANIYTRKKKGGMLPTYDILNCGLKYDGDTIIENNILAAVFGRSYLTDLIKSTPKIKIIKWEREWILWKCLVFSLWYEKF